MWVFELCPYGIWNHINPDMLSSISYHLNFVPMGFETSRQIDFLPIAMYLNFVPMGFETRCIVLLLLSRLDLNFVPMGFETERVNL